MCVCVCVCLCVRVCMRARACVRVCGYQILASFSLGSCYAVHKRIVNIMKVYIERNNMIPVELI